jgi:succinate dehydrogenase / fumarate reductase cytochrome b subunit
MNALDTMREGLRYRGESGQWAWIFHRTSGFLTVVFIITHVLDSTLVTFFPRIYQKTIKIFKHPIATLGEIVMIGAVLYHGVNGLRVTVMDFRPELWRYQKKANEIVRIVFAALFIPTALKMFISLLSHLGEGES